MYRRHFLALTLGAAASTFESTAIPAESTPLPRHSRFKALAFDGFPILDPRPVFALAEELFPGRGPAFSDAWKVRQFEYSWLRASGARYVDFWQVTADALTYSARAIGVELTAPKREQLMNAWFQLQPWPDEQGTVVGYLLSFPSESQYNDTEFCWFRRRLSQPFFYICQVVVAEEHRRQKIVHAYDQDLITVARKRSSQILCCEVNTDPPNFESFAFHRRLGFVTMGFGHASDGTEIVYLVRSQIPPSH